MRLESIDAGIVRDTFRRLGLEPLDGSNNDAVEIWIAKSGDPVSIPFYRRGERDRFVKQSFDSIIQELSP